jgi:hypothetical protein
MEDSIEARSNISWTPLLPDIFEKKYGYSLRKYLPLIMFGNNNPGIQSSSPGLIQCVLDTPDEGAGYLNDFHGALAVAYRQYIQTLTNWAQSTLDLQTSAQVSYNLPMDMQANIPFVNAPECESLGFKDVVDAYRQFSGPADLAGKRVISNELGAVMNKAYQYFHSDLIWSVNRAVAGGVNQFVLQLQTFTGEWYKTTWPGYTPFLYLFSDMYTLKQPSWSHGFAQVLGYISRLEYVQQQGVPRTDIIYYNKVSVSKGPFPTASNSTDLINKGSSFE